MSEIARLVAQLSAEERAALRMLLRAGMGAHPSHSRSIPAAEELRAKSRPNPWLVATKNLSEQARITRADPALAARMKQEAASANARAASSPQHSANEAARNSARLRAVRRALRGISPNFSE